MDEQESTSAGGHELASEVGDRVRAVISAAEAAANAVRHEAEQEAAVRRRVGEEEAHRIIEDAKADADAHLTERMRRIAELSDTVVERAETIVSRLDRAEEVRKQLQTLADALGESAEKLASEVRIGSPPPTVRSGSSEAAAAPEDTPTPTLREELEATPPPAEEPPAEAEVEAESEVAAEEPAPEEAAAAELEAEAPGEAEAPAEAGDAVADAEAEPVETPDDLAPDVVRLDRRDTPDISAQPQRREADQQLGARLVALQMAVAGGNRGEVEAHLVRTFELEDPTSILDDVFGQGTDADKRVAWPRTEDGAA